MKNIAIIITKLNGGGAERCASNLSLELSKKYNVILIVFDGRNISYPYAGKLIDLKIADSGNTFSRTINVLKRVKAVKKIKRENNIDCTISLLDGPNIVNTMSRTKDKVIVSVRNRLSSENVGKLRRKLIIYSSLKSDLTVSLSKMVKKDLIEEFGIPASKIHTVYNHCDPELLHDLIERMGKPDYIDDKHVYFGTMGRLNNQKGQWHLLRVFAKVAEKIPEAKLVIMGTGELENKLKALAEELEINDKVIFTGFIKNPHNVLQYCEMFIFPSLFEGLGNVLLEALAFNMPIVSVDCVAGPREILAPDTDLNSVISHYEIAEYGILCPVMDREHFNANEPLTEAENTFYEAILKMHEDTSLREEYNRKASIRIRDFCIENIINEWCNCIE